VERRQEWLRRSGETIAREEILFDPQRSLEMHYGPHPTIEGAKRIKMKLGYWIAVVLAGCLLGRAGLTAQAPAGGDGSTAEQGKPASEPQKPAAAPAAQGGNPFPEDTTSVPVVPLASAPAPPQPNGSLTDAGEASLPMPGRDSDPVRSPDDPDGGLAAASATESSSSSLQGMESLLPSPDEDTRQKGKQKEPTHQEAASKDIDVGNYYIERKDWKAALSRFESAMVLDPENPEVFWGLAEAERHLGDFASARTHYETVLEFDPDSRHGKEAKKALKAPEIANATSAAKGQSTAETPR
jgi:tetratricopeptide (TPR) repeat protein